MFNKWKLVILRPNEFFKKLSKKEQYANASWFYVIIQVITIFGMALFSLSLANMYKIFGIIDIFRGTKALLLILFSPLIILVSWGFLFVWAGIYYLFALLFEGKGDYIDTFKVLAYSSAPGVFSFVPFIGWIASIYSIILTIIGIKVKHKLTTGKSVAVVILPIFILTILIVGVIFMILALILGDIM